STAESSDEEPLSHKLKRLKDQNASSDDEPLVRKVKTAKVKDKFRKRANGEEDTVKQGVSLFQSNKLSHSSDTFRISDSEFL
ncbi:uncharacterized, partial [Tachysurus ichikawai]